MTMKLARFWMQVLGQAYVCSREGCENKYLEIDFH